MKQNEAPSNQVPVRSPLPELGRVRTPLRPRRVGQSAARDRACSGRGHDWLPWLRLENGSYVTWCVDCRHQEQWDE